MPIKWKDNTPISYNARDQHAIIANTFVTYGKLIFRSYCQMKPAGCTFVFRLLQALQLCFCPLDSAALHFSVTFPQVVTGILLIFLLYPILLGTFAPTRKLRVWCLRNDDGDAGDTMQRPLSTYLMRFALPRIVTSQIHNMIGWMRKNNRAARVALNLLHSFDVVCQTTTWDFDNAIPQQKSFHFLPVHKNGSFQWSVRTLRLFLTTWPAWNNRKNAWPTAKLYFKVTFSLQKPS